MIDINIIRQNPRIVKNDLRKRRDPEKLSWIDDLISKDREWRRLKQEVDCLRQKRNEITSEINQLKKDHKDVSSLIGEARSIPDRLKNLEIEMEKYRERIDFYLKRLPNILHSSVPYGKDDSSNKEVRKFGKKSQLKFSLKSHGELAEGLGLADFDSASKISGNGFYYLIGDLALLEHALVRFAIDFLLKKKYVLINPPLMMRRKPFEGVTDLESFKEMLYKIEGEDLFLIPTSEHPIASRFMNKTLKQLPLKYVGFSPCFRKEIGSSGVDTKGLFRIHQFYKVEQFIFCTPKNSWKFHEELIRNTENLYKRLKLPFRVVNCCTGDMGIVASKKYDIEAWFPRQNKYREVGSCSNCTDYQSRRLNIKYFDDKNKRHLVHTLNSTAIATERTIVAILENYQLKDGSVKVPAVLVPYMNNIRKLNPVSKAF